MTPRTSYIVVPEPRGAAYRTLLKVIGPLATEFGVIVRSERVRLSEFASQLMQSLSPYQISMDQTQAWPGSQLVGERHSTRHRYRCQPDSLALVVDAARALSEWVNPDLPEDLHFLRSDGSVVLGSIAQENEVWVVLASEEVEQLRALLPKDVELRAEAL